MIFDDAGQGMWGRGGERGLGKEQNGADSWVWSFTNRGDGSHICLVGLILEKQIWGVDPGSGLRT